MSSHSTCLLLTPK